MPELTNEQFKTLLNEVLKNAIPLSLNVNKQTEEKAIKELMPLLIVYAVFAFLSIQFVNISFILKWSCVSNIIAIIIRVWHLRCLAEIKKESKGE